MASLRFTDVQTRPTEFLDFTSLTLEEFQTLVPPFEAASRRTWRLCRKICSGGHERAGGPCLCRDYAARA